MFEVNKKYEILQKDYGVGAIIVDNFLCYPEELVKYLYQNIPDRLWKCDSDPSYNGKYFIDKRHIIVDDEIISYKNEIKKIINEEVLDTGKSNVIFSNFTKFIDKNFNDYKNNYWYPHIDNEINAILYLNVDGCSGTNVYNKITTDEYDDRLEHYYCWIPKINFELIANIESKFNRLVIFNGKFYHGMAINDDRFFYTERINLVSFFKRKV